MENQSNEGDILKHADKVSVWVPWYFNRGLFVLLTIPFFLIVIFSLLTSVVGAVVQEIAILRVSQAVFGFLGLFITILLGWTPVILPPAIIYSLIKNIPGVWLDSDASNRQKIFCTVIVVILLPVVAQIIYSAVTFGIGWIADQNPCAAYRVGVIGSKVPTGC